MSILYFFISSSSLVYYCEKIVLNANTSKTVELYLQQAELQEGIEGRGERIGGVQAHKRMVTSLEKQIAVQEKKLEQVWRTVGIL